MFSYGLKNNYESEASKVISNKLGFKWKYVEINQKIAKEIPNSEVYRQFIQNNCDGCATPTIQGLLAIDKLLKVNFIDKQDIIINGNSGDFITGGHIP